MTSSITSQKYRKYYIRASVLPFEEDMRNEFKGHRNLCKEEIPSWATEQKTEKASRKAISRNLNAFLNSGEGGTAYLGVVDDGKVHGINMTRLQRDHFLNSLDDLMSRYKPRVMPHQYSVRFTPVVDSTSTQEEIVRLLEHISSEETSKADKERKHILRTCNYCWCDKDAVAVYNSGKTSPDFVVEVIIKRWDPYDPRNPTVGQDEHVRIQPYYADEEGNVFFRRQASIVQYSLNSIIQITKQEVKDRYEEEIERLKQQYKELMEKKGDEHFQQSNSSPPPT